MNVHERYECPRCSRYVPVNRMGGLAEHKNRGTHEPSKPNRGKKKICEGSNLSTWNLTKVDMPPEWLNGSAIEILADLTIGAEFREPRADSFLTASRMWGQLLLLAPSEREQILESAIEALNKAYWNPS